MGTGDKAQHAFDCYERHVAIGDFQRYGRGHATRPHRDLGLVEHVAVQRRHRGRPRPLRGSSSRAEASGLSGRPRRRPAGRRISLPGLLRGQDPHQARGLVGKKGVLWWEIHRLLRLKRRARSLFLENVDRLLKSPAGQRGRDFAVMLASLADLGYEVEWRVVNAADYGFPQKRRRVFIVGRLRSARRDPTGPLLYRRGARRALPVKPASPFAGPSASDPDVKVVSDLVRASAPDERRSGTPACCGSEGRVRRLDADVEPV